MNSKGLLLTIFCFYFLLASISYGQSVQAPVYKNGDWWKIKVEVRLGSGISKSGPCDMLYSEYLVKVNQDKMSVFGLQDSKQEELDCLQIIADLTGIGQPDEVTSRNPVSFPMALGKSWKARYAEQREGIRATRRVTVKWVDLEYKVTGSEKIRTPKGAVEALKIEILGWPWGKQPPTYYYSPEVKTIVRSREGKEQSIRIVTLIDYSVNN